MGIENKDIMNILATHEAGIYLMDDQDAGLYAVNNQWKRSKLITSEPKYQVATWREWDNQTSISILRNKGGYVNLRPIERHGDYMKVDLR